MTTTLRSLVSRVAIVTTVLCSPILLNGCDNQNGTAINNVPLSDMLTESDSMSVVDWRERLTDEQQATLDLAYENDSSNGYGGTIDDWIAKKVVAHRDHDGNMVVVLPDGGEFTVVLDTPTSTTADEPDEQGTRTSSASGTSGSPTSDDASATRNENVVQRTIVASDEVDGKDAKDDSSEQDATGNAALLSVDTVKARPGDGDVAVAVQVHRNPGLMGLTLSVSYDESVMTLISSENGDAFGKLTMSHSKDYGTGTLFTWDGIELDDKDIKDGTILVLYFDVKADAKPGTHPISIRNDDSAVDMNLDGVDVSTQDGAIVIE